MPDTTGKVPDNEQEQRIYKYVSENESITTSETAVLLGVKDRKARSVLMNMVEGGYIKVMDPDTAPRYKKYIPYWA